jgi:hypothetical protein
MNDVFRRVSTRLERAFILLSERHLSSGLLIRVLVLFDPL